MKKLINAPADVVPEMLSGFALANPAIVLLGDGVAARADAEELGAAGQVALISGGGAGHEPAHAGYIGRGMLTAAVAGDVFSSPSADAVLTAIRAVGGPAGVVLIVKNYTGDRLNFGLAAEIARGEGIPVELVVVADDAALADSDDNAGRRGLAGTVLVHKIAGAAAESGQSLADVARIARAAAASVATMGVALSGCTVPAAGKAGLDLGPDEIEWGLGIHGEPGVERGPIPTADEIVDRLLGQLVADRDLSKGDRVVLLVNNLGGTPAMELGIIAHRAVDYLAAQEIRLERLWVGTFLTALEMAGCSLSLARVGDQALTFLDAPSETTAWPAAHLGRVSSNPAEPQPAATPSTQSASGSPALAHLQPTTDATTPFHPIDESLWRSVSAVCTALIGAEQQLTDLDQLVGDGDLGISLARGARAVLAAKADYDGTDDASALRGIAATIRRTVGGTSGPLYAALVLRTAAALTAGRSWPESFAEGVDAIAELGGAKIGDRTMLDALLPAAAQLRTGVLADAVAAARKGTDETAGILARRGRSSYLGERALGTVDPGAEAVVIWLDAIATEHAALEVS
ncbi:dihydroxyacetone kinase family protein [Kribbella catacumbae]|uniref:dihydroxyacetone kinase family protein n=1 Tax=Kribbella catacumbae TaxID=460086 RepID=UPI00036EC58A|nr:dihydroxyacetone kinase family protein [Kribbella catacumbae]